MWVSAWLTSRRASDQPWMESASEESLHQRVSEFAPARGGIQQAAGAQDSSWDHGRGNHSMNRSGGPFSPQVEPWCRRSAWPHRWPCCGQSKRSRSRHGTSFRMWRWRLEYFELWILWIQFVLWKISYKWISNFKLNDSLFKHWLTFLLPQKKFYCGPPLLLDILLRDGFFENDKE